MATIDSHRLLRLTTLLVASIVISACGGGGGGSAPSPSPAPVPSPPPPPAGDTTPPQVASVSPTNGQPGVDPAIGQIVIDMSESVQCPGAASNVVTLQGGGMQIAGTLTCGSGAESNRLSFGLGSVRLLYGTSYTVTIGGSIRDLAGNVMTTAYVSQFATRAQPVVASTRIYTANSGATPTNGAQYVSAINPSGGYTVEHTTFSRSSYQWTIAADSAAGKVYSAGISTSRGVDVIDVATGATTSISFDPDESVFEYIEALAVGSSGVYVAYSNRQGWPYQPTLRNRIFRIDRLTQAVVGRSVRLTADDSLENSMTPIALVVHPDPAVKRIYVLSAAMSVRDIIDASCGTYAYQPGTVGTVTELDAETLAVVRTFAVGSVPISGVIDRSTNRLIVGNAGDRTFSAVDLTTGVVTTSARLASFIGCRQPVGMVLDASGRLLVSNAHDGVHVFDAALTETALVMTGSSSVPIGLAAATGKAYVALWGMGYNSVAEITGTSVTRTISVGLNPVGITAFTPN